MSAAAAPGVPGPTTGEAARWLGAPLRPVRVVVHGVAGGVGTTTVATLLRAALARCPGTTDARPTVDDAAHEALLPGAGDLAVVPVVVCPATTHGLTAAARLLGARGEAAPGPSSQRAVVVAVPVTGRGLDGRAALEAARSVGLVDELVILPWSRALAARAGAAALAGDRLLAGRVDAVAAAVVRCARWRAAVAPARSG